MEQLTEFDFAFYYIIELFVAIIWFNLYIIDDRSYVVK